jgi:ABC-type bacteriocin/lantibiotic exporter with double-glycine peptidase domain
MKLNVPHFRQQTPYTCLPACVRMVLAYQGQHHDELELAEVLETIPVFGTPTDKVEPALRQLGYRSRWFENATTTKMQEVLAQSWPVIIFVFASDLPHGNSGLHALVLIELTAQRAVFLDPSLDDELTLKTSFFQRVWSRLNNQGMVVWV